MTAYGSEDASGLISVDITFFQRTPRAFFSSSLTRAQQVGQGSLEACRSGSGGLSQVTQHDSEGLGAGTQIFRLPIRPHPQD